MITTWKVRVALLVSLTLVLLLCILLGVSVGATDIPLVTAVDGLRAFFDGAVLDRYTGTPDIQVIQEIRAPRVLLGATAGAGLGVCGLITQSLLRNPLGDPYILGISSGASAGAAFVIVVGITGVFHSAVGVSLGAFLGAVVAIVLVTLLASAGGSITPTRIIFAGMAVNYFFAAVTSLVTLMAGTAAGHKSVMFWTLGSLASAKWNDVGIGLITTVVALLLFALFGRRVDVLNLGDDSARSLGTNPKLFRDVLFGIVAFTVAILVSLTGSIGFIGLVIPHLAKLLVGSMTRISLPIAGLTGAILLVIADIFARIIIRPAEMPIGILTAIVGTPMLMALIRKYAR